MKKFPTIRSKRAISPVIATVILVAVAITISVAVAYWMGGIAGQYTKFEKVEIQTAICKMDSFGNWNVTIRLKNTGTATATLTNVFINDAEVAPYGRTTAPITWETTISTNMTASCQILSGDTKDIIVWIGRDYGTLSSGTTVNIKIHSAGGMDYIKLIELV